MSDYISREAAKQILSRLLIKDAAECACNLIDCTVTHWMPLPEPPEEVQKNE